MRSALIAILLFMAGLPAGAQAVHYFTCVEVLGNGDVSLNWQAPGNLSDFVSYDIYHTTIANPDNFQLIGSIGNYGITSFVHSPTTANQQSNLYYISTEQNGLPQIISDTLYTMHLTVDNSDPYMAVLDWNAMHDPLLALSDSYYKIMSHNPSTTFSLVDSTLDIHFEVPVLVCWDTLSFMIEIGDDNGCISRSNIFSSVFRDTQPPPIPQLDSVSIDPYTGEVLLGWNESPAADAGGYVVYNVLPSINDTLDFVFGKENTSYVDISFDPCAENRSYALASMDTCGNISPGSYAIPQRTILLNEVVFDPCELSNALSWTAYINMDPALEGYRVYLSTDGGPFTMLTSLSSATTSFLHTDLEPGHSYRYFIRAFSTGMQVTSTSCFRELTTWQYKQPFENETANASVEDDEYISLVFWPDTYAFVPQLNIYRSVDPSGPWEALDSVALFGADEVYYDDVSAEVDLQSYYYRSSLTDSCGNEVLVSGPVRTMLLQGRRDGADVIELNWNAFEGWPAGVAAYEVYRAQDESGSFAMIGSTGAATQYFADNVSSLAGNFSELSYLVKAVHNDADGRLSYSNIISFDFEPSIFLPNAFTPGGANPVFRPVGTFARFSEYRMDIYNRWGELIFSSHDFGLGWEGKYKGNDAPAGVYVCIISYRSNTGESTMLKSTFVLIR